MEIISLKMDKQLLKDVDAALKKNRYSTRTEFVREAIRDKLTDIEKEEMSRKLKENFGIMKGKGKGLSDDKIRRMVGNEILKEMGLPLE